MKKWIMAAACILTFSGYAAAQSTTAKATSLKTPVTTTKKGTEAPIKKGTTKKTDTEIKLAVPKLDGNDSLAIPKPKDQ